MFSPLLSKSASCRASVTVSYKDALNRGKLAHRANPEMLHDRRANCREAGV